MSKPSIVKTVQIFRQYQRKNRVNKLSLIVKQFEGRKFTCLHRFYSELTSSVHNFFFTNLVHYFCCLVVVKGACNVQVLYKHVRGGGGMKEMLILLMWLVGEQV